MFVGGYLFDNHLNKDIHFAFVKFLSLRLTYQTRLHCTVVRNTVFGLRVEPLTWLQGCTVDTEGLLIRNANACPHSLLDAITHIFINLQGRISVTNRRVDNAPSLGCSCRLPGALLVYVTYKTSTFNLNTQCIST